MGREKHPALEVGGLGQAADPRRAFVSIGPVTLYFSRFCACQGFLSLGGHRSLAEQCLCSLRYRSVRSSALSPTLGMASRRARQRLKGGGGGDTGPAAEKLRELLGSREAGGAEQRPECVCGRRAWRAGGRAAGVSAASRARLATSSCPCSGRPGSG